MSGLPKHLVNDHVVDPIRRLLGKRHSTRVRRVLKQIRRLPVRRPDDAATLLIVGCQRSGTSLLLRLFDDDDTTVVFGERSRLFSDAPGNRRMVDRADAVEVISSQRARLVVVKPLVESHRTIELLDALPNARAIWLYRDYRDVARSNLRAFGDTNGSSDLAPIVARDFDNWRALGIAPATLDRFDRLSGEVSEIEAAALFWWVRNNILFDTGLSRDDRVAICRYTTLVADPVRVRDELYEFAGHRAPTAPPRQMVHQSSVGHGADVELSKPIRAACEELLKRLDQVATIN